MRARWPPACHVNWVTAVGSLMATALLNYELLLRAWQEWGCYVGLDKRIKSPSQPFKSSQVGWSTFCEQAERCKVMYSVALLNSGSRDATPPGEWQA